MSLSLLRRLAPIVLLVALLFSFAPAYRGAESSNGHDLRARLGVDAWLTVSQSDVVAGAAALGTIHLADPAGADTTFDLTSSDVAVQVPATVTVPTGDTEKSFPITTSQVGGDLVVSITASLGGNALTPVEITLRGLHAELAFNRASAKGGSTQRVTLEATLPSPLAYDVTLDLAVSDPVLSVQPTVTIPAGQTSVTVPVVHDYVPCGCNHYDITASYMGTDIAIAQIHLEPIEALITFESPTITSGESTYAFVTLDAPTREALTLYPYSFDGVLIEPETVTINAGARTAFYRITSLPIPVHYRTIVILIFRDNYAAGLLTLLPVPTVKAIELPSVVNGVTKVTGTVKLNRPAGEGGEEVTLASSDPALGLPASVTVAKGALTATFEADVSDVAALTTADVTATGRLNDVTRGVTIKPLSLATFALSAPTVTGGGTVTGTITLKTTVAVDTEIQISCDSDKASVPTTVTVHANTNTATFTVQTSAVTQKATARITVTTNGKTVTRPLKVLP
ncbi:hypothetical protein BH11ARM2_BH11ARM2_39480 [soil metagenome]